MHHSLFPIAGLAAVIYLVMELVRPVPAPAVERLLLTYHLARQLCAEGGERQDHWCRKENQKLDELRARGYPI